MKKIMIIEDTKDSANMIQKLLKSEGFDTVVAFNGQEALDSLADLKNNNTLPDLVLLDMFMPEMSGREVCEKIRMDEGLKELKVAFLTAAVFRGQGKQMLEDLNVLDYIVKPFDVDDLLTRVKKLLEE
jgi:CheY-like chemotaxis protein